jgi:hypothetical protein
MGAEFSGRNQKGQNPAEKDNKKNNCISMGRFQLCQILFGRNGLPLFVFRRHNYISPPTTIYLSGDFSQNALTL